MKSSRILFSFLFALFALVVLPAAAQSASQNGAPMVVINPGGGLDPFGRDGVVPIFNGFARPDGNSPVPGSGSFNAAIDGSDNQYFAGESQWCCWSGYGPVVNIDGQLFGEASAASDVEGPVGSLPWDSVQVISTGGTAVQVPAGSGGTGTGTEGDGTATIRYTMVYDGRTYQMDRAITYTYPNAFFDETYTFTIPSGNPHTVKFYLGGDSSPGGTDVGLGYMKTTPYRSIFSSNPESQVYVGFQETGPTNPFDFWFVGQYDEPYEVIQMGDNLDNAVSTTAHDAGLQFQWTLPTAAGTYTRNSRTILGFNKIFLSGQFQTSPITTSQTSIYTITVQSTMFDNQPNGVTFWMDLPEGLEAVTNPAPTTNCVGGDGAIYLDSTLIGLSGGVNAESTCTISAAVRGEPGTYDLNDADFYIDDATVPLTPRDGTTELVINEAPIYQLTVNKNGTGTGYVSSDPEGIDCGSTCSEIYDENTVVELSAGADEGSVFAGWSGAGCSGTGTCSVTMSQARTVTATFNVPPTPSPKLAVKSKTSPKKIRAGKPFRVTATVSNTGTADANGVKTCIRIPKGTAVASKGGGTVENGRICWTEETLADGDQSNYSASFRTLRSTRGKVKAAVSASATNAPSASDPGNSSGTVRVLPARKPKPKPPTG